jgi:hypothetical protein
MENVFFHLAEYYQYFPFSPSPMYFIIFLTNVSLGTKESNLEHIKHGFFFFGGSQ